MLYWKKLNISFFHIPRTGGVSCWIFFKLLFGPGTIIKTEYLKFHEPLYKKKQLLTTDVFDSINVINNVRNPFEYLRSLYTYFKQTIPEYRMKLFYKKEIVDLLLSLDFYDFIYWYVENGLSFKDYLFIDERLPDNLYIVKLETFSKDMISISDQLNFKLDNEFGEYNKSDRIKYVCHYTPDMLDKVYKKFNWVFDNYYKDKLIRILK